MSSLREHVLGRGSSHLLLKRVLSWGRQRGIAYFLIPNILQTALARWMSYGPQNMPFALFFMSLCRLCLCLARIPSLLSFFAWVIPTYYSVLILNSPFSGRHRQLPSFNDWNGCPSTLLLQHLSILGILAFIFLSCYCLSILGWRTPYFINHDIPTLIQVAHSKCRGNIQ